MTCDKCNEEMEQQPAVDLHVPFKCKTCENTKNITLFDFMKQEGLL